MAVSPLHLGDREADKFSNSGHATTMAMTRKNERWSEEDLAQIQATRALSQIVQAAPLEVTTTRSYSFCVMGAAEPAGSKQAFVPLHPKTKEPYRRPGGGIMVSVVDANKASKRWKQLVAKTAQEECGAPLLTGPLKVTLIFYRERPKAHFSTVGLNKTGHATPFPITKPDSGKLARGTIDAMTGIIYKDDAQIVEDVTLKRYGSPARVEIIIEEIDITEPYEQPALFDAPAPWDSVAKGE